jgi:signal transduction histidine kinase
MSRTHGVVGRLALGLFLTVALALVLVYFILVPSLDRRLTDSRLTRLENVAAVAKVPGEQQGWQTWAADTSDATDMRVVLYVVDRTGSGRTTLRLTADSQTSYSGDVTGDPVATEAATNSTQTRGTVERNDTRYAEVARMTEDNSAVLLLSSSLRDSLGTISLVRRLLIIAGLIALAVCLALGYGAARLFARRIKRLERAADRIASGEFDEPVVDSGNDELGQLAAAFERMRLRLGQLDNARREFIANASHELRTPIFSLSGFLELLSEEDLDEETRREFLATMREQVDRLTRLATDLLDLSRVDAGQLHVERVGVDLGSVAAELGTEFGALAQHGDRDLHVEAKIGVFALGDEQRILQVGRALVGNALVHAPPGSHVHVSAAANGGRALLRVEDDGPGIPPDKALHVFERFYRVDGAVASGSGLGLAIARDLAELMQGEILLESVPGRTVFTLALPRAPRVATREPVLKPTAV